MVYNRCVGTRYCSNNCPYKVRRFNFLLYQRLGDAASCKLLRNPDVTVRSRGVMEKCTYCVQRINARQDRRPSARTARCATARSSTACQQACPTQAIVFGDLNDPAAQVSQLEGRPAQLRAARRSSTRARAPRYLATAPESESRSWPEQRQPKGTREFAA